MKDLTRQTYLYGAAAIICASGAVATLFLRFALWELSFVFCLVAGGIACVVFLGMHKELTAARAIAETAVLRIYPAVISVQSEHEKKKWKKLCEESAAYVSCFGILLGKTVVKFNQDGIKLRNVEIGKSHICFKYEVPADEYSMDTEKQSIRLLYSRPDGDELAEIVEAFSTHAGVIPVIVG